MNCRDSVFRVASASIRQASVRYRALMPILALSSIGRRAEWIHDTVVPPAWAEHLHSIKPLVEREAAWVEEMGRAGRSVIVDLCDNIFAPNYGNSKDRFARRFRSLATRASAITVPTNALAERVRKETDIAPDRVFLVPDIAETPALLQAQEHLLNSGSGFISRLREFFAWHRNAPEIPVRSRRGAARLLWFGNHGSSFAAYGIEDLLLFENSLRRVHATRPIEVWVASNNHSLYASVSERLGVPTRYFEWESRLVDRLLARVDLCLVPNSLDEFSTTKSANRALKALAARVPVVATDAPAYSGLRDCVWTGDTVTGILTLLDDANIRESHLASGAMAIQREYSLGALAVAIGRVHDAVACSDLPRARY